MQDKLDFLKGAPQAVEPGVSQPETVPSADIDRVMAVDGVEGVWLRVPPVGTRAVIVAISKESARNKIPSVVNRLPVEFQFTGPIKALPE